MKPFHKYFIIALILIFIFQGGSVAWIWIMGKLISSASLQHWGQLPLLLGGALLIGLIQEFAGNLADRNEAIQLGTNVDQHLEEYSLRRILRLTISQHKEQHSAIKLDVVAQGEAAVRNFINRSVYILLPSIFFLGASIITLFLVRPTLGIVAIAVFVGFFMWSVVFQKGHYQYIIKNRDNWTKQRKERQEAFTHLELVKTLGREEHFIGRYLGHRAEIVSFDIFTSLRAVNNGFIRGAAYNVVVVGFLSYALYLFAHGSVELGAVYTAFALIGRIMGQTNNLERAVREIPQDWARIERYLSLIDMEPDFDEAGMRLGVLRGDISFKNIVFGYPNHEPILNDFTITIPEGKVTAFVGHSGSGKTTVGRLLLRAYPYTSGNITIGNNELAQIDAQRLRQRIGVVEQHVDLFDVSVRENILVGVDEEKREAVNAHMQDIAERSRITEFAHRLGEAGYDALVGERGLKLSGGERQRVGIARALAKDPDIFLFDEATASLDAVNEKHVMDAVYAAAKDKTTIIIAHRLSTVRNADKIVMLERGKVIAEGTHDELMAHSMKYQELVKHQVEAENT